MIEKIQIFLLKQLQMFFLNSVRVFLIFSSLFWEDIP